MRSHLFREEVIAARRGRLEGNILIIAPVSWQLITAGICALIAVLLFFLASADYQRTQSAPGKIVVRDGVTILYATKAGQIAKMIASEGKAVRKNQELAVIDYDQAGRSGFTGAKVEQAILRQQSLLEKQVEAKAIEGRSAHDQLSAAIAAAQAEVASLDHQISLGSQLLELAVQDRDAIDKIAVRGFISKRELRAREELIISRRQALADLRQKRESSQSGLLQLLSQRAQQQARQTIELSVLQSQAGDLLKESISVEAGRSLSVRAPSDGRLSAINVKTGQFVDAGAHLFSIIPTDASLEVELAVPSTAIGMVKRGQIVKMAIDAFPYQRYGTISGELLSVAAAPIVVPSREGALPIYLARVRLDRQSIHAFGRNESLLPGMSVSARIIAEKQSLVRWLLEPFYAVATR